MLCFQMELFLCVSLDAEPPWIQCPGDIVAGTDERRGTANVSWNVPTATDNSEEQVGILKTKFRWTTQFCMTFYFSFTRWQCRWNQFTLLLSFSPSGRKPSPTSPPITRGTKLTARLASLLSVSLSLLFMWNVWVFVVDLSHFRAKGSVFHTRSILQYWHSNIKYCIPFTILPQELQHFNG